MNHSVQSILTEKKKVTFSLFLIPFYMIISVVKFVSEELLFLGVGDLTNDEVGAIF